MSRLTSTLLAAALTAGGLLSIAPAAQADPVGGSVPAPVAHADTFTVTRGTTLWYDLLANDECPTGCFAYSFVAAPGSWTPLTDEPRISVSMKESRYLGVTADGGYLGSETFAVPYSIAFDPYPSGCPPEMCSSESYASFQVGGSFGPPPPSNPVTPVTTVAPAAQSSVSAAKSAMIWLRSGHAKRRRLSKAFQVTGQGCTASVAVTGRKRVKGVRLVQHDDRVRIVAKRNTTPGPRTFPVKVTCGSHTLGATLRVKVRR